MGVGGLGDCQNQDLRDLGIFRIGVAGFGGGSCVGLRRWVLTLMLLGLAMGGGCVRVGVIELRRLGSDVGMVWALLCDTALDYIR